MAKGIDRGRVGRISWIAGGLVGLALVGVLVAWLLIPAVAASSEALPFLFSIAAVAAAVGAFYQGRLLWHRAEKVSGEMDALSARLLRIEGRLTDAVPQAAAGLKSAVAEVTGEIALLGGLVRDLAVTVATQDRDVATLKDQVERTKAQDQLQPPPHLQVSAPPLTPKPHLAVAPVIDLEQRARERAIIPSILPIAQPQPEPAPQHRPAAEGAEPRRIVAVMEAFEADRIELHLQPIVSLPQRKSMFYEVLARLRLMDDTILVPAEFLPILERADRIMDFDRKVLTRAAVIARHLSGRGSDTRVSCNISPASLQGGVLRAASRIAETYPDVAGRLILELSQRCWRDLDADTAGTIARLRSKGFAFALDRATDLRLDPLALAERGVSYVKLPADLLLKPETTRGLDIAVGDLTAVLTRAGIRLIAERVEREEDVPNLLDLDVPLAQGFVFAPPRAIRPEVLSPTSHAAVAQAAAASPEPQAAAAVEERVPLSAFDDQERRPYRTYLRRAG